MKYSAEIKARAVKLSYEKSINFAAQTFGVHRKTLSYWRNKQDAPAREMQRLHALVKKQQIENEILKKAQRLALMDKKAIFHFIQEHAKNYPVLWMCQLLGYNESTYYRNNKKSKEQKIPSTSPKAIKKTKYQSLTQKIKSLFFSNKKRYGYRRITAALKREGITISRHIVARIMQKEGLEIKQYRKKKITTRSNHSYRHQPNLLDRKKDINQNNQVWVSDITYLKVGGYWRYFTMIMDLYNRQIIGWSLSHRLCTNLTVVAAWKMAIKKRKCYPQIFHSDRGVQYASRIFKKHLRLNKNLLQSMSATGCSLDNANAESFFKTFKYELADHFENDISAKEEIIEFIDWYNEERLHSALGYSTPVELS